MGAAPTKTKCRPLSPTSGRCTRICGSPEAALAVRVGKRCGSRLTKSRRCHRIIGGWRQGPYRQALVEEFTPRLSNAVAINLFQYHGAALILEDVDCGNRQFGPSTAVADAMRGSLDFVRLAHWVRARSDSSFQAPSRCRSPRRHLPGAIDWLGGASRSVGAGSSTPWRSSSAARAAGTGRLK
jgi:hypothetical protein